MKLLHLLLNQLHRVFLSIAVRNSWSIRQLDVKNTFLNGFPEETTFIEQPPGFAKPSFPNHVCHLKHAFYGLKKIPRAWFDQISVYLLGLDFFCSKSYSSLFILHSSHEICYALIF